MAADSKSATFNVDCELVPKQIGMTIERKEKNKLSQFKINNRNTGIFPLLSVKLYAPEAVSRISEVCELYNLFSVPISNSDLLVDSVKCAIPSDSAVKLTATTKIVGIKDEDIMPVVSGIADLDLSVSTSMTCSTCKVLFEEREEQKEHYKLDWHRLNIKLKSMNQPIISEDEFEQLTTDSDVLSISGSDTDSHSEDDTSLVLSSPHGFQNDSASKVDDVMIPVGRKGSEIYFKTPNGEILSLYRCVLYNSKNIEVSCDINDLQFALVSVVHVPPVNWAVIMLAGGHFAAAIYNGASRLLHKTFHRYVVRAKRGTAQSVCDNRKGMSNTVKSCGAGLRRYNQAALTQEIQDLLSSWSDDLGKCSHIFVRAASYNKSVIFSKSSNKTVQNKCSGLNRNDLRVRMIPFATRRPTLQEVARVYDMLSTMNVYDCAQIENCLQRETEWMTGHTQNKEEDLFDKKGEINHCNDESIRIFPELSETASLSDADDLEVDAFAFENVDTDLKEDLCQFDSDFKKKRKKIKNHTKTVKPLSFLTDNIAQSLSELCYNEHSDEIRKELQKLYGLYMESRIEQPLKGIVQKQTESKFEERQEVRNEIENSTSKSDLFDLDFFHLFNLSAIFPIKRTDYANESGSLLHLAAFREQDLICALLLELGFDPTSKSSSKKHVPYTLCSNPKTRQVFKDYSENNPLQWNWNKASIPVVVSSEVELERAEKRAAKRRAKKSIQKVKKAELVSEAKGEAERKWFLSLSDREKRAVAAERRMMEERAVTCCRCFQCGQDMTGKVPFEYMHYRFCEIACLKAHKQKIKCE